MDQYLIILFRTILIYFLIVLIFRMMGKREIGELSILDLVVFIMIAEIAVVAIEDYKDPILPTLFPMFILLAIQVLLAFFSLKSKKMRDFIEGEPTLIIKNGKIDEKAMRSQRYNYDDLLIQLREKNIRNIADVEFAILETSGKLSVFEKEENKSSITIPLIMDGIIQESNLERIGKTNLWLRQQLKDKGYVNIKNISFCSYQDGEFYIDVIDH
ncbi:DUF421 domain-containing protein [Niallia circulans]|uniref:Membrane protein n=1 Tax=Niallia circulans TaxID=1397 RepID=A0A0J1I8R3_NIACI|nr:DUF421 domain-containing protein [Niallia circulans]KLV22349.1 membrane protein [Niallia circulans]MCM2980609.1 DUF421 domain-containing protein [Niallia circulans]MDR4317784.1 DUF421 domain-containing protein [Niallia circulans]MED3841568.1 DUF421 domain-containing protein [Niallia circulans]MED4243304.1 DUF421 domain-containing protein [Niallia circulans]